MAAKPRKTWPLKPPPKRFGYPTFGRDGTRVLAVVPPRKAERDMVDPWCAYWMDPRTERSYVQHGSPCLCRLGTPRSMANAVARTVAGESLLPASPREARTDPTLDPIPTARTVRASDGNDGAEPTQSARARRGAKNAGRSGSVSSMATAEPVPAVANPSRPSSPSTTSTTMEPTTSDAPQDGASAWRRSFAPGSLTPSDCFATTATLGANCREVSVPIGGEVAGATFTEGGIYAAGLDATIHRYPNGTVQYGLPDSDRRRRIAWRDVPRPIQVAIAAAMGRWDASAKPSPTSPTT